MSGLNAVVYAGLGILIFVLAFVDHRQSSPRIISGTRSCEEKNIALAVLIGAMSIGMCIIIAAAVH